MGFGDLLRFKSAEYETKISDPDSYKEEILQANIYRKRREMVSAGFKLGICVGSTIATMGMSPAALVGIAFTLRTMHIAHQKKKILKKEWKKRGGGALSYRKRDILVPACIGLATVGVEMFLAQELMQAFGNSVTIAGSLGAQQLVSEMPDLAAQAISGQAQATLHGLAETAGNGYFAHINGADYDFYHLASEASNEVVSAHVDAASETIDGFVSTPVDGGFAAANGIVSPDVTGSYDDFFHLASESSNGIPIEVQGAPELVSSAAHGFVQGAFDNVRAVTDFPVDPWTALINGPRDAAETVAYDVGFWAGLTAVSQSIEYGSQKTMEMVAEPVFACKPSNTTQTGSQTSVRRKQRVRHVVPL